MYLEEDYLLLSGIQHYAFCKRQWALIHIEQQWEENLRTTDGKILHERTHDASFNEKRGGIIITRSLAVASSVLGVRGTCDVVEFHEDTNGVQLYGRKGRYLPVPVEYKKGQPKTNNADEAQLCAQALCLEEMLGCGIGKGYLYYGEPKKRTEVVFTQNLRNSACGMIKEMHALYDRKYTPKVKTGAFCRACSLKDICLPKLNLNKTAAAYIRTALEESQ
jgi:CRISPR-associated exonuclease Cas4